MDTPACTRARQHLDTAKGEVSQAHQDMNHAHSRRDSAQQAVDAATSRSQAAYERQSAAQAALDQYDENHLHPGPDRRPLVTALDQATAAYESAQQALNNARDALETAQILSPRRTRPIKANCD
jgi:chromosome segregation protein